MSDAPTPCLSETDGAALDGRGYEAGEVVSFSPFSKFFGPAIPEARPPRPVGMLGSLEVLEVLPRSGRGPRKVVIRDWPTPISPRARTELPPQPRKPVYGPAARE